MRNDALQVEAATCIEAFKAGQFEEAERQALRILVKDPDQAAVRTLWKMWQHRQGRPIDSALPLERKREIFSRHRRNQNDQFFARMEKEGALDKVRGARSLAEIGGFIQRSGAGGNEAAERETCRAFGLDRFELWRIEREGIRHAWKGNEPLPDHVSTRGEMREELRCPSCHGLSPATFWPSNGDMVAFYYQSAEETRARPAAFSLPVTCPHCEVLWYVVWDEDPDPAAGLFVRHVERMCDGVPGSPGSHRVWRDMIQDGILGPMLAFVREYFPATVNDGQVRFKLIKAGDHYTAITLVPSVDPTEVRRALGGSVLPHLDQARKGCPEDTHHFAHWFLCFEEGRVLLRFFFLPRRPDLQSVSMMLDPELLTREELLQAGVGQP